MKCPNCQADLKIKGAVLELEFREEHKETKISYRDNVKMTKDEYRKLCEKFGFPETKGWVDRLSEWKHAKGKRTKSDYYTILTWARNEVPKELNIAERLKSL